MILTGTGLSVLVTISKLFFFDKREWQQLPLTRNKLDYIGTDFRFVDYLVRIQMQH